MLLLHTTTHVFITSHQHAQRPTIVACNGVHPNQVRQLNTYHQVDSIKQYMQNIQCRIYNAEVGLISKLHHVDKCGTQQQTDVILHFKKTSQLGSYSIIPNNTLLVFNKVIAISYISLKPVHQSFVFPGVTTICMFIYSKVWENKNPPVFQF